MRLRFVGQWFVIVGTLLALVSSSTMATAQHASATPEDHGHEGHGHGTMSGSTGNGVVYLTIANTGDTDDALIGGETDRAERIEIHEMITEDEIARMQPVEGELPIPAGETVDLEPGGLHLMLINLTTSNQAGDIFEVTLAFKEAGDVTLTVPVRLDADPADGDATSETVEAGDLVLEGVWSRPAPRLGDGPTGTPDATPAA